LAKSREGQKYLSKIFVSKHIPLKVRDPEKVHVAELKFHDLDHSKESFEARVFINNPKADHRTSKTEKQGYAGSLYVFGHGTRCWGGPMHCQVKERFGPYDLRSSHQLTPTDIYLPITERIKKVCKTHSEITVTIVPIMMSFDEVADEVNVLNFKGISLNVHGK
jgi:hypothetical protein